MPRESHLDRAIASLEQEILVLQLAVTKMKAQRPSAQPRVRAPKKEAEK